MSSVKSLSEQTRAACHRVCLLSTLKRYWQCWDRLSLEEAETESTTSSTFILMEPVPWGPTSKQNLWTAYTLGQFSTLPAHAERMWALCKAGKHWLHWWRNDCWAKFKLRMEVGYLFFQGVTEPDSSRTRRSNRSPLEAMPQPHWKSSPFLSIENLRIRSFFLEEEVNLYLQQDHIKYVDIFLMN